MRSSLWFNTLGQGFVATAFNAASQADPNAKLYLNDFNIEGTGAKSTAVANLVRTLKSQGVPIHGIGVQSHFIVGAVPTTITQNLNTFASLGVEVAITELDIRMTLPSTTQLLTQQQNDYQNVIKQALAVPQLVGITVWDYTDKYSWIPGAFAGQGAACPFDQNLAKKPAYTGALNGLS